MCTVLIFDFLDRFVIKFPGKLQTLTPLGPNQYTDTVESEFDIYTYANLKI